MKTHTFRHIALLAGSAAVLLFLFSMTFLMEGCQHQRRHYVVGVSQCSEDSWRTKLKEEIDIATYFNEGVTVRYATANDDEKLQERQINEMVEAGIDVLIVSPQQIGELSDAIDNAYDKGIPVVLFDRKTNSEKYTAFMGADNYLIGTMMADYVSEQLGGRGHVVMIGGLKESSPAIERRRGFMDGLKKHPGLILEAEADGDWTEPSGEEAMKQILKDYSGPIDAVMGGNDRMAVGSRKVLAQQRPELKPLYFGVDALPFEGMGMAQVRDGILTASALYPTHGDELLQLALDVVDGHKFERENFLTSSIVTHENARVLLLQQEEVMRQSNYLRRMHARVDTTLHQLDMQRLVIIAFVFLILLGTVWGIFLVRINRQKHKLNHELEEKNRLLAAQRDEMEAQRDEMEVQRDKICEQRDEMEAQRDVLAAQRDELAAHRAQLELLAKANQGVTLKTDDATDHDPGENTSFYNRLMQVIELNIGNSEFSVENLSDAIGMSRAQLYRRCKSITGNSPVEVLRIQRMQRAGQLLSTRDQNISEVTYACGFTSPSYFTKCFRDHYGMSPTDFIRHHQGNKHNPA